MNGDFPGYTLDAGALIAYERGGLLGGRSRHSDITDVHVALNAQENGHAVVMSDPDDLRRVDPDLEVFEV